MRKATLLIQPDSDAYTACASNRASLHVLLNYPGLEFVKGNDLLQTRVRTPRDVPPNIALYCDWVIWRPGLHYMNPDVVPRLIYLLPSPPQLKFFIRDVLPKLEHDFVLVTSSRDVPLPLMMHEREGFDYHKILDHPKLKAWFTENRDLEHDKIHALPIGIPNPEVPSWIKGYERREASGFSPLWTPERTPEFDAMKQVERIDRIFGCWYRRIDHKSGTCPPEDNEREQAREYFDHKPDLFDWHDPKLSREQFLEQQGRYRFVLCPHGGGLDPNPKCWESLLMGAIPIVVSNTTNSALAHLPVVRVEKWSDVTRQRLNAWGEELAPRLKDGQLPYLMSNEYYVKQMRALLES